MFHWWIKWNKLAQILHLWRILKGVKKISLRFQLKCMLSWSFHIDFLVCFVKTRPVSAKGKTSEKPSSRRNKHDIMKIVEGPFQRSKEQAVQGCLKFDAWPSRSTFLALLSPQTYRLCRLGFLLPRSGTPAECWTGTGRWKQTPSALAEYATLVPKPSQSPPSADWGSTIPAPTSSTPANHIVLDLSGSKYGCYAKRVVTVCTLWRRSGENSRPTTKRVKKTPISPRVSTWTMDCGRWGQELCFEKWSKTLKLCQQVVHTISFLRK